MGCADRAAHLEVAIPTGESELENGPDSELLTTLCQGLASLLLRSHAPSSSSSAAGGASSNRPKGSCHVGCLIPSRFSRGGTATRRRRRRRYVRTRRVVRFHLLVGEGGLEPPRPCGHRHLKPARLPIPPLARVDPEGYQPPRADPRGVVRTSSAMSDQYEVPTTADLDAWFESLKNWGRWGADDERGALNHLTPARRAAAATLVRDGVSVSLARDLATEPSPENAAARPPPHAGGRRRPRLERHPRLRSGARLPRPRHPRPHHDARRRAVPHVRARRDVRRATRVRRPQRRRPLEHDHVDGRRRGRARRPARRAPGARASTSSTTARPSRSPTWRRPRPRRASASGRATSCSWPGAATPAASRTQRVRRHGRTASRVPALAARPRGGGARQRRDLRPDAVPRHRRLAVPRPPDRHHRAWACTSSTTWS